MGCRKHKIQRRVKQEDAIYSLASNAARVLWKFTEGKEDWNEWYDLSQSLRGIIPYAGEAREEVHDAVMDFSERRRQR